MGVQINNTNLLAAGELIRARRTPNYFLQADKFIEMWSPLLQTPPDVIPLLTNLTAGLDELYESNLSAAQSLSSGVLRLLNFENARAMLQATMKPTTLQQAVEMHLAYFTAGYDHFADPALRDQWYGLWQRQLREHHDQQLDHAHMIVTAQEFRPAPAEFNRAALRYVAHFHKTSALAVTLLASFPFLPTATPLLLNSLGAVLPYLECTYRFALDVRVDMTEPLNVGVYALAAEEGLSLYEARRQLQLDPDQIPTIETRLLAAWETDFADTQLQLSYILAEHPTLKPLCEIFFALARRLTSPWKYA